MIIIFQKVSLILILFTIFISVFFIPIIQNQNFNNSLNIEKEIISFNPDGFTWPIPGYTKISSYFGKRKAPTNGASTYHYGIDIPAPEGTKLIAVNSGQITFCSFLGAGGYTITLSFEDYKVTYCHVDPNFIVSIGDTVEEGEVIGYVGPKYVYGVKGNTYTDESGKPTNGATTGCHLHLGFRVNDEYSNPLNFF